MNKVSVIIPIYNAENTLPRCLDSLCGQTIQDIEIICINDKSEDSSLKILDYYSSRDKRIIVHNLDKNSGCNVARNYGIRISSGEYVGFVDADDFVSKNYFEELYKTAIKYNSDIAATDQTIIYNSGLLKNTGINYHDLIVNNIKDKSNIIIASGISWNKIYKRDFLINNNIKFFETKIAGGDNYFTTIAVICSNHISVNHKAQYYYVQTANSIVHKLKGKESFAIIQLYESIEKRIAKLKNITLRDKIQWLEAIKHREKIDFETFKRNMSPIYVKNFVKMVNKKVNHISMLEHLFSIKNVENDSCHKVIRILGLQFKFRSKRRQIKALEYAVNEILRKQKFLQSKGINKEKILSKINNFKSKGINETKREQKIIVSLTSYPDRMYDIHYCIYSLLNQTLKPDEVILWLAEDQFPNKENDIPYQVLKLRENGLSIKWCKDLKSYKKLIPALQLYPDDIIVTADDDIFYESNWLESLYSNYKPNCITAHRCHKIHFENNTISPYSIWVQCINDENPSFLNFATGAGGIMYPPHCFYKDISNVELFKTLAPNADDIWFWAMSVLQGTKIKTVTEPYRDLIYINPERELNLNDDGTLFSTNKLTDGNDAQLEKVIKYYPQLIYAVQSDSKSNQLSGLLQ